MCRLFAMTGGSEPVSATFWLLQAPDSLSDQGRREPDGTGLGWFDERDRPVISKQPLAADEDATFAREAKKVRSRTFVAHVRYATTGALVTRNTHPFEFDGRIFAHNGMVEDLPALERELGPSLSRVQGDTDSERLFALITKEIERLGDVGDGIASAIGWVAAHLRLLAVNFVMIDANDLWALRYPEVHDLFVLERTAGGGSLDHARGGRIRASSPELADRDCVVVATERMDDDPGWRQIPAGELVHVDSSLTVIRRRIVDGPPAHPISLSELEGRAAAAQGA
jgi:predicted glutamine amidotransferase